MNTLSLIDSHCHLNRIDLSAFNHQLSQVLDTARLAGVTKFLSVCVELEEFPALCDIATHYPEVFISLGVHPDSEFKVEPSIDDLMGLAAHEKCIAIGETGLDYYRIEEEILREKQRERFRRHIRAALKVQKPLIIHTRQAAEDTIALMKEEGAERIGGVMHCFTETWEIARLALELNFYISLSGIVTFKNATTLHELAKKIPRDRLLIETDAPYLAPVPFRGQQNHPALVRHVAEALAVLRDVPLETLACETSENFYRCFRLR